MGYYKGCDKAYEFTINKGSIQVYGWAGVVTLGCFVLVS